MGWRVLFVFGALLGPLIVIYLLGRPVAVQPVADGMLLPVAGLLVGLGTAIGSGCTSGHGICGLARLSLRSAAAVGIFMCAAVITVYVIRHTG